MLNENLNWMDIISSYPSVKDAFRNTPCKVRLPKHQLLCRFITAESKKYQITGNEIFASPWWTVWEQTHRMLLEWRKRGAQTKDIIRARLSITTKMNREVSSLVQIVLTEDVYAWQGIAKHQTEENQRLTYLGGANQLYLPGLPSKESSLRSDVAMLQSYTAVDWLE